VQRVRLKNAQPKEEVEGLKMGSHGYKKNEEYRKSGSA
jgi:hypothetical protein